MKSYNSKNGKKRTSLGCLPRLFVKDRRAVNTVISNMILIAAVIVLGFVVLSYAQNNSHNYEYQYQETVNSDISKLKESISFEYAYYNATTKNVLVYFLNSGDIAVTIDKAYLSSSPQNIAFSMYYKNGVSCASHILESGQEGHIVVNANLGSGSYQVKVVTERESNFAYDFIV